MATKDGQQSTNYIIPNTNNGLNCYGEDEPIPIGPTARSLNKDYAYESGIDNQLDHWGDSGIFAGAPSDKSTILTIAMWRDKSANLDDGARGYLAINCVHCHHALIGAADTSGLFLEYYRALNVKVGECKPPVASGHGSGDLKYDIVPGDAAASILHNRMDSAEPEVQIPEVDRTIIHAEGLQLIGD